MINMYKDKSGRFKVSSFYIVGFINYFPDQGEVMITFTDKQHAESAIDYFNGECVQSSMSSYSRPPSARTRGVWEDYQCGVCLVLRSCSWGSTFSD